MVRNQLSILCDCQGNMRRYGHELVAIFWIYRSTTYLIVMRIERAHTRPVFLSEHNVTIVGFAEANELVGPHV